MANKKASKTKEQCLDQFKRTTARTGHWRGEVAKDYKIYKSKKTISRCDHLIVDKFGVCENCKESVGRGLDYQKQNYVNYKTKGNDRQRV